MENCNLLEECRKLLVECDWDSTDTDIDSILYRPWMDDEKKFRLGFDPRVIAAIATSRMKEHGCGPKDLKFLIQVGAEVGSNLDTIAKTLKPDHASRFKRLSTACRLVSQPSSWGFKTEVTLLRLCLAFPTLTCSYLHHRPVQPQRRRPGGVSLEAMAAVVPDYPPAMMTYAFAFLVPDRDDAYCAQLMKAHMLHEYEAHRPLVNATHPSGPDDHKDKVIVHVVKRTLAAIAASWISYDLQVAVLKRTGLVRAITVGGRSLLEGAAGGATDAEGIAAAGEVVATEGTVAAGEVVATEGTVDEEEIVVAEHVAAAARAWDEKDSKNYTEHFTTFYRPLKTDVI